MFFLDYIGENYVLNGFYAEKGAASGTAGSTIDTYSTTHWNPLGDFNSSTGVFTMSSKEDVVLLFHSAAAASATPAGSASYVVAKVNGTSEYSYTVTYSSTTSHTGANFTATAILLSPTETLELTQNLDTMETVRFGAVTVKSPYAFTSTKGTGTGSAGDVIAGYAATTVTYSGMFNTTSGVMTAPVDGYYLIMGSCDIDPATGTASSMQPQLNGTDVTAVNPRIDFSTGTFRDNMGHAFMLDLTAGDEIQWRQNGSVMSSVRVSGLRIPNNSASVFSAYVSSWAGGAGVVTGYTARINDGSDFNTSTGEFTAPSDGVYIFFAMGNANPTAGFGDVYLRLNDTTNIAYGRCYTSGTMNATVTTGQILDLTAGDVVDLRVSANTTNVNFCGWRLGD